MTEIERKFLVAPIDFKELANKETTIKQGYLNSSPERTVRIRIRGEKGFITIKGKSSADGLSRYEWEKEIPVNEAEELLSLCESGIIEKVRFEVKVGNHLFEVDQFSGANEGLVIAEIELTSETEDFERPEWLLREVTGKDKYYNSRLSKYPFTQWKSRTR